MHILLLLVVVAVIEVVLSIFLNYIINLLLFKNKTWYCISSFYLWYSKLTVSTNPEEYEECRQSGRPQCLLQSISSVCIWAASWKWGLSPSAGEDRPLLNTCMFLPVCPRDTDLHCCPYQNHRPAWSGPPCKCPCALPQKRSCRPPRTKWWWWESFPALWLSQSRWVCLSFDLRQSFLTSGAIMFSCKSFPNQSYGSQLSSLFLSHLLCRTTFFSHFGLASDNIKVYQLLLSWDSGSYC